MHPDRIFRSKVDVWLMGCVVGAASIPLGTAIWLAAHGQWRGVLLLGGWTLMIWFLMAILSWPLTYTLQLDRLHIRSGWLEWDVAYAALRGVAPSRSIMAGPAWSLERVRLDVTDSCILVSPEDREAFIQELAVRCPHLARSGVGSEQRLILPHEKAAL